MKNNRRLRHCMVVFSPYPYFETRVQREAEALIARGHEVDVICPKYRDQSDPDYYQGVSIHRVNMHYIRKNKLTSKFFQYLLFFILALFKLNALHLTRRYDSVQVHNLPDFLVFVALLPKIFGARVILDLHDLMPEFYQGCYGHSLGKINHYLIVQQEKWSCRFADRVITVTEHWRQTLNKRGVPLDKCTVVMNLADPRLFHQLTQEEIALKDKHRFCLFYHGSMPERYGLDLVLRAMDKLRYQIPGLHFMLVGGGSSLELLKKIMRELSLNEEQVEFIDGALGEKLTTLLAKADIAVVPYRNDVFTGTLLPTKLMEYAVVGLPTIAARTSAISAYFDDDMVEFFQPGNVEDLVRCIRLLYENSERRNMLARGILRFNERHNWTNEGAAYVALVENLCA